jgi:hypothetical protein
MNPADCVIQNHSIPAELLAPLRETTFGEADGELLRDRLRDDGYLFLRGALKVDDVLAARRTVFERLAAVGEISEPAIDGIFTETSRRKELAGDLGRFWQSVSEEPRLRVVSHGEQTRRIMTAVLGEPARPHDYLFLRPGVPGRATKLHYDYPFFARGSQRIITVWTALGEIPVSDGPLVVVEGSHRFDDLIEPIRTIDYESSSSPRVQLNGDPIDFARERRARLLSADFHSGDLIVFTMTTLHGSLDNHSPINRCRLSCDVRWQPAADQFDPRYQGPNPPGTTGAGYGELNGAKPLTVGWHER